MTIDDIAKKELESIEEKFQSLAKDYKMFELFLYKLLNHTLEEQSSTIVKLGDVKNPIRKQLLKYEDTDLFRTGSAFEIDWNKNTIFCYWDVHKILTTIEAMEDFFGTVDFRTYETYLDSDKIEMEQEIIDKLDENIRSGAITLKSNRTDKKKD